MEKKKKRFIRTFFYKKSSLKFKSFAKTSDKTQAKLLHWEVMLAAIRGLILSVGKTKLASG